MKSIQKEHFPLIIKYIGISFITWAISHGVFSGTRAMITGVLGIVFFVIGTILLKNPDDKEYIQMTIFAAFLAIGIGALTWWLQHFLDSPERSVWIVPLWFLLSVIFYGLAEKKSMGNKKTILYIVGWTLFFTLLSLTLYQLIQTGYFWSNQWHGHGNQIPQTEVSPIDKPSSIQPNHDMPVSTSDHIEDPTAWSHGH
jgi:hypothetical protein